MQPRPRAEAWRIRPRASRASSRSRMSDEALQALRSECELVSKVSLDLSEDEYTLPTRCAAWNVKELLAHMYRDVDRTNVALAEAPPPSSDADSVSYWTTYDRVVEGAAIADRAKELAASYRSGQKLAEAWDEMWRRAVQAAGRTDGSRVVATWGPALALDEFLKTRVLEITVHGTDLAEAVAREPWATPEGLHMTNEILRGLLGGDLPSGLGWDDLTFLEKGTGRADLLAEERDVLGTERAGRFPLMG